MNKRHIHNHGFKLTLTVLLTALLMAGHVSAQVMVKGNVYGGGNLANVQGAVEVNIKGGQIGDATIDADHGNVYGGGALANTNTDNWDNSALTDDPYISITITEETDLTGYYTRTGAAAPYTYTPATGTASTGTYYKRRETKVNLTGGTIKGDAYGGGLGRLADPEHGIEAKIATEYGDVLVTVAGTKMVTGTNHGRVFGANNINGTPKGHVKVLVQKTTAVDGQSIDVAAVFGGGNQAAYDPYSATEKAEVEINKTSGEGISLIVGNVFGGGNEAGTENTAGTEVKIMAGNVKTGVYGGCNTSGTVSGDTKVAITGGTIGTAWENAPATFPTLVFGGGLGHETLVNGSVMVELGAMTAAVAPATTPTISGDAIIWGDVYGGSAEGLVNAELTGDPAALSPTANKTTSVVFYSGTLNGNLYGGGLGTATHAADVYGNITVNIGTGIVNEGVLTTYGNATINGSVFGCNNTNGTPKGDVFVNVYKTAHISSTGDDNNQYQYDTEVAVDKLDLDVESEKRYAIQAVYGGGNLAHYTPVALTGSDRHSTTVHVYVCDENTVKAVYGGGNAANVGTDDVKANTNVIIEGGRFYTVFGGGNGAGANNPGANIKGTAKTEIKGGLFNQIFGGSDTKGNVDVVDLSIESESGCILKVNESFGGANMSDLTGDVITTLTCSDDITIGTFYGGSNQADINGNVTLNVYGGTFNNVFGGSKGRTVAANADDDEKEDASADISGNVTLNLYGGTITDNAYGGSNINGRIGGKITVNVLDNGGTCALNIGGNIYGAGNVTPYAPTYNPIAVGETERISPVVNLIHGTVTNVFGGAMGATAEVTSNPQVNIGYDADLMGSDFTTSGTLLYKMTHLSDGTTPDPNFNFEIDPSVFAAVVTGNVYGGGDLAQVTGNTQINLRNANSIVGNIFGGGNEADVTHNSTVNIIDGTVNHDVYGGGALADVGTDGNDATQVTITGGTVSGSIYGGGLGQVAADAVPDDPATTDVDEARPAVSAIAALVNGAVTVTVNGGTVTDVFGCNNVNGAPQSTVTVNINNNVAGNVYGGGNEASYTGSPAVNVNHGTVTHSVYGGGKGSTAVVTGNPVVTIGDSNADHCAIVTENVYGGGDAATVTGNTTVTYNDNNASSTVANLFGGGNAAGVSSNTSVTLTSGKVTTAVYGGCNTSGTVGGTSTVTVTGGTLGTAFTTTAPTAPNPIPDVLFGGGLGKDTQVTGKVTVALSASSTANIYGNVYGGSKAGQVSAVDVNLLGSTIFGNVFGGGYQTDEDLNSAATDVTVTLNGTRFDRTYNGTAQIFGCNNLQGTPTGHVKVHVLRTENSPKPSAAARTARTTYDVAAVYGGGNQADYVPTDACLDPAVEGNPAKIAAATAEVIIEGCEKTSINHVYGGGNAAAVPATDVTVKGTYIINTLYGGGNGSGDGNPGANVGIYKDGDTPTNYGTGKAVTKLLGGYINNVYGGSNTKGDVRGGTDVRTKGKTEVVTGDCCSDLNVGEIYGAGSHADVKGDVNIILECMPDDFVDAVYGGAEEATIDGNVTLTVTSGKFGRVFGGNNKGGNIKGSITVNVYEDGCEPLIIGELYGGGNAAPYSIYGCEKDERTGKWSPNTTGDLNFDQETEGRAAIQVNVVACTSVGKVFGGGMGATAKVIGNTNVDVNLIKGIINGTKQSTIGKVGQVFGGGGEADVIGNTLVEVGTKLANEGEDEGVNITSGTDYLDPSDGSLDETITAGIYGGGYSADVDGNTTLNIGTKDQRIGEDPSVMIAGDIFGGGYGETTTVTGNVTVNIGANTGTNYVGYANINGDVYGGSAKGKVNATKSGTAPNITYSASSCTTSVNLYGCTSFNGNLYGGGLGDNTYAANVYGPVAVNVYGGTANNVFGCNNVNGAPQSTVTVTMNGGTINNSIYGGGNQAAYSVETNPDKDDDGDYKKYPVVNINNGTVTGNVFGGGYGLTATVTGSPQVTIGDNVNTHTATIGKSVYGGGELAGVDYDTNIRVLKGAIGDATGVNAGETYGNVYGAGKGAIDPVDAGIVKGNTNISISGGNIYHNIYGGGAYGSVGTYSYNGNNVITGCTSGGLATINITGGTIGINGKENGMVFGSSRGDVEKPVNNVDPNDLVAWVANTAVIIGTAGTPASGTEGEEGYVAATPASGPDIKGSIYGGGENGHTYQNASVTIHGGTIGVHDNSADDAYRGNVYGGGCGTDMYDSNDDETDDTYNKLSGIVRGTATVLIDGGQVMHNVYGAGAMGSVNGNTSVTITGDAIVGYDGVDNGNVYAAARGNILKTDPALQLATVGSTSLIISGGEIKGSAFGGGEAGLVSGAVTVSMSDGIVRNDVYGGGALANTNIDTSVENSTSVTLSGGEIVGNLYGGGLGDNTTSNETGAMIAALVYGNVTVTTTGGKAANVYGCNNLYGAPQGTVAVNINGTAEVSGAANAIGNVYGGGNLAAYTGSPILTMTAGTVGNVFGGGLGSTAIVAGSTTVSISGGTVNTNVYGGGSQADVTQNVAVTVSGGQVINDVYGGGALANTNTDNWDATKAGEKYVNVTGLTVDTEHPGNSSSVTGYYEYNHITGQYSVTLDEKAQANKIYYQQQNITGTWADGKNEANSTTYKTSVSVTGGTVGNVYGGGLGRLGADPVEAKVYGDVEVTINKEDGTGTAVFTKLKEATNADVNKTGRVFGCNNLNGSPKGNVTVTVWGTNPLSGVKEERDEELYDVQAVYGGGNLAEYIPVAGKKVQVNIHGCNTTSIEYVFGGGNAAIVPNTDVVICGCWEIGTVFGGGNGSEPIWDYSTSPGGWIDNLGADVPGTARVTLLGGYIHSAFGGSYERGFCGATVLEKPSGNSGRCEHDDCRLQVTDVYGGGQKADTGIINLTISGCTYDDEVTNVYAASYNARVLGNVTLNIWGGKFENVFGGNKDSGLINGKITINIEEVLDETCTNNKPIEIKNLYGGCNAAPYPGPIRTNLDKEGDPAPITDPKITINVISCTSIGNIYGGSLQAPVDCNTEININMIKGYWAGKTYNDRPIPDALGAIGNVYGGGNRGQVNGNTVVNIGSSSTVHIWKRNASWKLVDAGGNEIYNASGVLNEGKSLNDVVYEDKTVLGANITGDVYGGGNVADVTGNTYVNICYDGSAKVAEGTAGVKIGGSVYGGGCEADAKSNTFVTMSGGYVFDGVYGGGLKGSVGTFTRTTTNLPLGIADHASHTGCVGGKPDVWTDGTGKCTVLVNGGQVGPVEVVLENGGMKNTARHFIKTGDDNEPVDYGFVFGAGRGAVESDDDPDAHFHTYVKETDVTIGGTAFILGSVYGGGENGRVKGNTLVKIQGGQIGCGEGKYTGSGTTAVPTRYAEEDFIDPTTATAEQIDAKAATMTECPHWEYTSPYYPHDPYGTGETDASLIGTDGHTYYGNVFGGGSGYYPYKKADGSHDWLRSAGLVEGNTEVQITGGHILTNVYGGNEMTDVLGTCTVTMSGGTLGVPRTLAQIAAHPVTCYLFGAGKGDQRVHFNKWTNVGDVNVTVSGGIIYGSVFGGGEDGHVGCNQDGNHIDNHGNVTMTIGGTAKIGTWGTSYVDGNVFGGGRGFSGEALTAGNVSGNVNLTISGGTMLGSIYGGGRLASVGYDLRNVNESGYGVMSDDPDRGHVTVNITGGTIGNNNEYKYIAPEVTGAALTTAIANMPNTLLESNNRLKHTKGGNVFAGGMGRRKKLDGVTDITDWMKLGNTKSTKLTISGADTWIMGNVYGGGEFGTVTGSHTSAGSTTVGTEIIVEGGTIGTEITESAPTKTTVTTPNTVKYTFGSIYGGGMGSEDHDANENHGGTVTSNTSVSIGGANTKVRASVYGGGEMALVESDTHVTVSDGEIGRNEVRPVADANQGYVMFGGATMGNVYGAGKGNLDHYHTGQVKGDTYVTVSGGSIYHNVYGGGALGSVGTFSVADDGMPNTWTSGGTSYVTITGGTIGISGRDNGMVNGSSRGDVSAAAGSDPYDKVAWIKESFVVIGTSGSNTGPTIKGSVYGGGENGHNADNANVTVYSGTIGISDSSDAWYEFTNDEVKKKAMATRGNVFGAGCGTDTYTDDNGKPQHNAMAGIVQGNTNITINGNYSRVVHNVYGGGSMGSVGKSDNTGVITSGGKATVNISGGKIGPDKNSDPTTGNVFGATRGEETFKEDGYAQVKTTEVNINDGAVVNGNVYGGGEAGVAQVDTHVNMSGGNVALNVYGGGYLGNVGIIDKLTDPSNYKWTDSEGHYNNTGICHVTITGGTVGSIAGYGNVFGAGKGSGVTFQCENAMVYDGNVTVSNGTVNGNVYGGGEVGRVENNTTVNIGSGTGEGPFVPDIKGSVFGGGKGLETHGYSALTRGNTEVTVQGNAQIANNVYGGGEIASVGRYGLNAQKMPNILLAGGECKVTVQGNAIIGPTNAPDKKGNVFGGGKGVETAYNNTLNDPNRSKRMVTYDPTREVNPHIEGNKGTLWWPYPDEANFDERFVWEYFTTEEAYTSYLETLALTTAPDVTIDGNATINGSVFGGGEIGLTKGEVNVNIKGGTMEKDVYGGGALADTNTTKEHGKPDGNGGYLKDEETGEYIIQELHSVTNVNLLGGHIKGDAFGGALGQRTGINSATSDIPAVVHGDITVTLNGTKFDITHYVDVGYTNVVKSGRVFGCNNLLGSPQGNVTVKVYKTVRGNTPRTSETDKAINKQLMKDYPEDYKTRTGYVPPSYELAAVYGGGNLAPFEASGKKANVEIYGCNDTSIETVYGGGNAACVPETFVTVWGCYEIGSLFGGGNGKDKYKTDTGWVANPGADVNGDGDNGTLDGDKWIDQTPGNATTWLYGGTVHDAYGGSDTKGTVTGSVFIDVGDPTAAVAAGQVESCPLDVGKIVGAGKNADVDGDLIVIMGCKPPTYIPLVYGGADNANVKGKVELTLTSGNFGKVFGGNNLGGAILGHIQLNIEETGDCSTPLTIEELYLGGNQAAYSAYGYYVKTTTSEGGGGVGAPTTETPDLKDDKLQLMPRKSADDPHKAVKTFDKVAKTWTVYTGEGDDKFTIDAHPELNIISCTSIGQVYGGGLGARADMYANPTVNINMIKGSWAGKTYVSGDIVKNIPNSLGAVGAGYTDTQNIEHEGGVFGGGNEATVHGNTTVNIGTATTVNVKSWTHNGDDTYTAQEKPVEGANIVSNVYGGGNLADVTGNTYVNICAVKEDDLATTDVIEYKGVSITGTGNNGVTIKGNVFGGGKGTADSFKCAKAMVGEVDTNDGNTVITKESADIGTRVSIGNGTIEGTVYGGGEIGRVEWNSVVTVGLPVTSGTSAPVITGDVYGAGKGVEQYGYAALVRGNTFVTVQADAKVGLSVYGGGEISSVGKYNIVSAEDMADPTFTAAHPELEEGMPWSLANSGSGYCNVIVRGNAEIGPDDMQMTKAGGPDDFGHVFGAGRGILPYENETLFDCHIHTGQKHPGRMAPPDGDHPDGKWECFYDTGTGKVDEDKYLTFIETQGLATQTDVTIGGNAFVKGSVYGGSMDGHVQHHTHVTIADDCQIGAGYVAPTDDVPGHSLPKYTDWPTDASNITTSWAECAHWPYAAPYAPYDKFATYLYEGKYYFDEEHTQSAEGGALIASDGHTWYGNVFGGGSGVIPYKPGKWHRAAGSVGGNATVDITGGHILTSVYGGNENTDVGTYTNNDKGQPLVRVSGGKCTINMTGGTIGVPRTVQQMKDHPVTCYLFGAGKGDQRIFFNTWTNVQETVVNVSGTARIYGSIFGGGEDGHVLGNAAVNIGGSVTIDGTTYTADSEKLKIGTTGTSYVDGNVFGGGRGFSGEALTAGSTGGNVTMNIAGGTMLGSVYGGGRLASVGIPFTSSTDNSYGQLLDDVPAENKTYGHITINISGGTIGTTTAEGTAHPVSGNVFGGSMGRITLLDGSLNDLWPRQAVVKMTNITISGGEIKNSVYGGSEFGIVRNLATVNMTGGTVRGNVFGGGYGSDRQDKTTITPAGYSGVYYTFTPMLWTGCVSGSTFVNISGGTVEKNVYGGGDMASVGLIDFVSDADGNFTNMPKHESLTDGFGLSWPYKFTYHAAAPDDPDAIGGGQVNGKATVTVTGGRIGTTAAAGYGNVYGGSKGQVAFKEKDTNGILQDITDVNEQRYTEAFCANVREAEVNINYASTPESDDGSTTECIVGAVYGGGQDGHVYEDAHVRITGGLIGLSVYGGGEGESTFNGRLRNGATETPEGWNAPAPVQSITAGKVYGNTSVSMSGGHVIGHVYGGGNLASVGKGNYASGADDYYPAGYGERLTGNLWTSASDGDNAWQFLNSGKITVAIAGGKVGTPGATSGTVYGTSDDATPTGMVFGGCRGRAAEDVMLDPRHEYAPDFYLGYANETKVTIGGGHVCITQCEQGGKTYKPGDFLSDEEFESIFGAPNAKWTAGGAPEIYSQVFGGGRDGHVRGSAHVIINDGTIGQPYSDFADTDAGNYQRYHRGNVYGSGSGLGLWDSSHHGMSSGSVTRNTTVDINGGTIYNNVYGGGALSSVGPPKLDPEKDYAASTWSKCTVNINGGTIGDPTYYESNKYGGCVYGASRGNDFAAGESTKDFATVLWTEVNIKPHPTDRSKDAVIAGNVYGGGATGDVKCNTDVSMTGGTVGHDVFGGGKGDGTLFDCSKAMVGIEGEGAGADLTTDENKVKGTRVTISNGTVNGNVYGGGEVGRVEWNTQVKIGVGTGDGPFAPVIEGSVFGAGKGLETHGYSALVRGNSTVTVQGAAKIGHNVYGGGEMATVGRYWVKGRNNVDADGNLLPGAPAPPEHLPDGMPYQQQSGGICTVTIQGSAQVGPDAGASETAGHVFGAGQGVVPTYYNDVVAYADTASMPKRMASYDSNDYNESNKAYWKYTDDSKKYVWDYFNTKEKYQEFLETLALVTNANVTVDGSAQVQGNVYGGSESGFVQHDTYVTIQDGTIGKSGSTTYGKVFGGGKGLSLSSTTFTEAGKVKENTRVDILGGIVYSDVYGGGALGKSNTNVVNNAYPTATVNLKGGTIYGSAYGGGLGDAKTAADVGNTILHLNENLETTAKGCIVKGYVFGANNTNGTPLGHTLVHIHATQNADKANLKTKYPAADEKYDVEGVFGGGNASDYVPAAKDSTEVIIEGCDLTSIHDVYGGGYGAAVPGTVVLIKGTYLIDNVFGGGYGAGNHDNPSASDYNPGANVGTLTGGGAYSYVVTGKAHVKLMAGRIHHVYGASNTKGDILGGSSITTVEKPDEIDCNLIVDDIFGGGNEAPMVGGTEVVLGCMPNDWIEEVYAGSQSADVGAGAVVGADVSLTITSGKFGRVFGGNKSSGIINGGIEVHIEENPDCDTPIIIGELYAGGNMAPYSAYGYANDGKLLREGETGAHEASPVAVHAKAFTSIGKIFGGGKGSDALLIGNPSVLVDEVESEKTYEGDNTTTTLENGLIKKTLSDDTEVTLYPRTSTGTMGVVGTIFGGGNEAPVEGNTTVKIATNEYVVFWSAPTLDDVRGFYTYERDNDESPYVYKEVTGTAAVAPTPGTIYYKKVQGADIRGNVYGGGNNAEVTGDTNVVIGRKAE